ncbi:PIN domain-containing protein [Brasilonema sp. UFV-L1]|uniref:PIN domain-containing protein n=1 Tax=Brasilonema sp. UFV-L1 TaxID=2234130 RepID=UPI00145DAB2C|nr:nucleic acid-binding protein [Brasilonema sp. UFV-L1]
MSLKIVYLDSGILINAFQGIGLVGVRAIEVLDNTACQFATSQFVQLETLPKAIYNKQQAEAEFYESFFSVTLWATKLEQIVQTGNRIACTYGLAAMDALHIAAALSVDAEEFVTTEKTTKPMPKRYRNSSQFNC